MNLKIGGIYTYDTPWHQDRGAIIIINKKNNYISYYMFKIRLDFTKNDIETILNNQIKYLELRKKNFWIGTKQFLLDKIDGYMGQVNEDILVKLSDKFKSCS